MSHYSGSVPDTEPGRAWLLLAACRSVDPEIFFPDNNVAGIEKARRICRSCLVIRDCLADCLREEGGSRVGSRWGVYAGLTPRQRVRLHEKLRNQARRTKAAT